MSTRSGFAEKVRVVLSTTVTYLTALGVIIGIIVHELSQVWADADWVIWLARVGGTVATICLVAVAIIVRVQPVLPWERGVLPQDPAEIAAAEMRHAGVPEREIAQRLAVTPADEFGDCCNDGEV